jgi:hypothetical protein
MMIRYLLRWMLILSSALLLPVLLIRAQPYDDRALREFLTPPEGCPAPCFMGIRPGVTTAEEAEQLLAAQSIIRRGEVGNSIQFNFSRPHNLLDESSTIYLQLQDNRVLTLDIRTTFTLSELLIASRHPDWGFETYTVGGSSFAYYTVGYKYNQYNFRFQLNLESPRITVQDVLQARVTLQLGTDPEDHVKMMQPLIWNFTTP